MVRKVIKSYNVGFDNHTRETRVLGKFTIDNVGITMRTTQHYLFSPHNLLKHIKYNKLYDIYRAIMYIYMIFLPVIGKGVLCGFIVWLVDSICDI